MRNLKGQFTSTLDESVALTKQQIIAELTRSPHGALSEYLPVGRRAASQEPEFTAHLIAWNAEKGQVRDSKTALPVVTLSVPSFSVPEFAGNSLAHLALLDPRNLVRALRFGKEIKTEGHGGEIRRLVERYLRVREEVIPWFDRTALAHRESLKSLYGMYHVKPGARADEVLFKGQRPKGSVFEAVAQLGAMPSHEAAGTILERKIPFLVASGALGARAKDPVLVLALIERMSPTELVTHTKALERLGIKTDPALRAAYEAGLQRAASSTKATLKTTRAAQAMTASGDTKTAQKLSNLQEKQIEAMGQVEGNWLVLADKSGSMAVAIETARQVASILAKVAKGEVHLVFFDTTPRHIAVTGRTYEDILEYSKHVTAGGGTSVGVGLSYAREKGLPIDGIAVVSDMAENTAPLFHLEYPKLVESLGKEPPVYLYRLKEVSMMSGFRDHDLAARLKAASIEFQEFDLRKGVDFYSLPNVVKTMKVQKYGLIDEIMAMPLLTLDAVFSRSASVAA